jgi:hypothetical protein
LTRLTHADSIPAIDPLTLSDNAPCAAAQCRLHVHISFQASSMVMGAYSRQLNGKITTNSTSILLAYNNKRL